MAKTKKKRDKAYRAKVHAVPWWYQDGESADSLRRTFGLYLYEGALALERGDATETQVNVMCALFRLTKELSEKMENSDELRNTLARAEAGATMWLRADAGLVPMREEFKTNMLGGVEVAAQIVSLCSLYELHRGIRRMRMGKPKYSLE